MYAKRADCDWQVATEKNSGSPWCFRNIATATTCPEGIFDGFPWDLQLRWSSRLLADLFPNCVLCMQVISGQLPTHDCKVFAYLIPGHIQHTLVTHQPEEQHGFRSKYRFDKLFLTANVFLHHATAHGIPVWLESLDFSKAFDCVHWPTVWNALRAQGISDHIIWMLSNLCGGHSGEVRGKWGSHRNCPQLSKNFWRETRVCSKSSCIFRSAAVGYESSEARRSPERI